MNASLVEEQQEAAARAAEQATKPQDEPTRPYFSDPEVIDFIMVFLLPVYYA